MVLPDRRNRLDYGCMHRLLGPAQLARQHRNLLLHPRREPNGPVQNEMLGWWTYRGRLRWLHGRFQDGHERPLHLVVRWSSFRSRSVPGLQGLLSLSRSNSRLLKDGDLPRPSSTLRHRLHCLLGGLMVLGSLRGSMLAYRGLYGYLLGWRNFDDFDSQCRRQILWSDLALLRTFPWPQPAALLGNNSRTTPTNEESSAGGFRQLCLVGFSLVLAILLPHLASTSLRYGRWYSHRWMRNVYRILYRNTLVCDEEEQGTREGGGEDWHPQPIPIPDLIGWSDFRICGMQVEQT